MRIGRPRTTWMDTTSAEAYDRMALSTQKEPLTRKQQKQPITQYQLQHIRDNAQNREWWRKEVVRNWKQ